MPSATGPRIDPDHYPAPPVEVGHSAPCPRRIRAFRDNAKVLDTLGALYVWEIPYYPTLYLPRADVDAEVLALDSTRSFEDDSFAGLVRVDWDAVEAWFEEDEQIFVHPRSPYSRVDALRSSRLVRVELDGVVLAESASPVLLFETGLPTRHYLPRTDVDFSHLEPSDTVTPCPYKGLTTDYWSVRTGGELHEDLAWSYVYPTPAVAPIAGLVAFYDEKVDVFLDGVPVERPRTKFSDDDA